MTIMTGLDPMDSNRLENGFLRRAITKAASKIFDQIDRIAIDAQKAVRTAQ